MTFLLAYILNSAWLWPGKSFVSTQSTLMSSYTFAEGMWVHKCEHASDAPSAFLRTPNPYFALNKRTPASNGCHFLLKKSIWEESPVTTKCWEFFADSSLGPKMSLAAVLQMNNAGARSCSSNQGSLDCRTSLLKDIEEKTEGLCCLYPLRCLRLQSLCRRNVSDSGLCLANSQSSQRQRQIEER